jgi:hypothetical protein
MTQVDEYDEGHNADESGMPGPGAPTPLSALEVYNSLEIHSLEGALTQYGRGLRDLPSEIFSWSSMEDSTRWSRSRIPREGRLSRSRAYPNKRPARS